MNLQGVTVQPPKVKTLVIPRDGVDLVFQAQYVDNYDKFDELAKRPIPMKMRLADGTEKIDMEDKDYIKEVTDWSEMRSNWMFMQALSVTEGLEYDILDENDPKSWLRFDEEFKNAGFSLPVIERIKMLCFEASGLNQALIDEATERFLAGQAQESKAETSPDSES